MHRTTPTAIAQERAQTDAVGAGTPGLNTAIKGAGGVLTGAGLLRAGLSAGGAAMNAGAPLAVKALGFGADAAGAGAAQAVGNLDNVTTTGPDGKPVVSSRVFGDYASAARQGAQTGAVLGAAFLLRVQLSAVLTEPQRRSLLVLSTAWGELRPACSAMSSPRNRQDFSIRWDRMRCWRMPAPAHRALLKASRQRATLQPKRWLTR